MPDNLEGLSVEKNVETIVWEVLENSCLGEVNNCLIAKYLSAVLLVPPIRWHFRNRTHLGFVGGGSSSLFLKYDQVRMAKTPGPVTPGLRMEQKHSSGQNLPVAPTYLSQVCILEWS